MFYQDFKCKKNLFKLTLILYTVTCKLFSMFMLGDFLSKRERERELELTIEKEGKFDIKKLDNF